MAASLLIGGYEKAVTGTASLSYIRYSQICAQVVRAAMKPQYKAEAEKAAVASVKIVRAKKE